jgi:hypothetical protein
MWNVEVLALGIANFEVRIANLKAQDDSGPCHDRRPNSNLNESSPFDIREA